MEVANRLEAARPVQLAFCVSGAGRIFREVVEHAGDLGIEVALLIAERRADPGLDDFCRVHGVSVVRLPSTPREAIDDSVAATLLSRKLDLVCLTFDKLVPDGVVDAYQRRMLNLHMGLLPGTEGLRPLRRTLASGAHFGGATIHEVTRGTDTGPIVAQCVVGVLPDDTPQSLSVRIYPLARDLMLRTIAWYAAGRVRHDASGIRIPDAIYGSLPSSPVDP
jgi:folate-dependent phosphoribosylglycinamide formyltransferase PurN